MPIIISVDSKYLNYQKGLGLSYEPIAACFSVIFFFKAALESVQPHTLLVDDFKYNFVIFFSFVIKKRAVNRTWNDYTSNWIQIQWRISSSMGFRLPAVVMLVRDETSQIVISEICCLTRLWKKIPQEFVWSLVLQGRMGVLSLP